MLLGEPARTTYDWNFQLLGIRIRIHPLCWAIAALLGIQSIDRNFALLVLWILAVFISIVVHELGHATSAHLLHLYATWGQLPA